MSKSSIQIKKAAVVGLGSMGIPMAKHMLNQGYEVSGYDVNDTAMYRAADLGVNIVASLEEIAQQSEVVIIMVQTDEQVKKIVQGQHGLLNQLAQESVICIASSTSPFTCRELAKEAEEKNIGLLDTPVCLGQRAADNGTLTVFVGGHEGWLNKAEPVLSSFGKKIIHVGEIGTGQIAKTANNILLWTCVSANYEVLSLAKKMNVDINKLISGLMESSGANWSLSKWGNSTGKWAEKDMDVALDLAQELNFPMPLSALVDQLMKNINQEKMRSLL